MTAGRLHDVLEEVARDAPEVRIPAGLYRTARRRRRWRRVCSAAAVAVIVMMSGLIVIQSPRPAQEAADGSPGLPDRLVMPPWWTETVTNSPAGPASVVFGLSDDTAMSDGDEWSMTWWRDYAKNPSVVVGLNGDTYRIARGGSSSVGVDRSPGSTSVGVELSPDGRYLFMNHRVNQVLDLTTGKTRQVLHNETGWWSTDGRRITISGGGTTTVVSWPSTQVEWTVTHPDLLPGVVALSPDASMVALAGSDNAAVYRSDGTRLWTKPLQGDRGAGRAAWRADGKLALFHRTDLTCDVKCLGPSTWRLAFVDALTGVPVDGPAYPPLRSAEPLQVVAWRGDTAYAVVVRPDDRARRVELVRLRPGVTEAETVLTPPAAAYDMNVATDYVDTLRPAGSREFGFNWAEVIGPIVNTLLCSSPLLALIVWMIVRRRRRPAFTWVRVPVQDE